MNSCHTVPKCKHAKTWKRCCTHEFSPSSVHQSLDDGRPEQPPQQKAPLRQETNMANFSYRFSIYNINGQPHTVSGSLTLEHISSLALFVVLSHILMSLCLQRHWTRGRMWISMRSWPISARSNRSSAPSTPNPTALAVWLVWGWPTPR